MDLEPLTIDGAEGPPHTPDGVSVVPQPRPLSLWIRGLAGVVVVGLAVTAAVAVHFERERSRLRGQLGLARQTEPNLGQLAYDGSALLAVPSPPGTSITATVTFVKVKGQRDESVWVFLRAAGLDPKAEFDLETQSCDGQIGDSLDKGGSDNGGASVYDTEKLGVPHAGRSYNVVVRRTNGEPVAGLTIASDKTVKPLPLGVRGC